MIPQGRPCRSGGGAQNRAFVLAHLLPPVMNKFPLPAWVAADDVLDGSGSRDPASSGRPPAELTPRGKPMAPPGLPLGRWIMAGATGRRCDASRTIQPDLVMHGDATWDLYISDLAYYISHRAYGHDDADGRGRSHQHDDMRPLYIRPCLLYITGLRA